MEVQAQEQALIGIQHPLENPLILDLVFGYFQPLATFQEWKNIRTVCKTWYFQTLSKWRTIAVLNLKLGSTRLKKLPRSSGVSMSEFLRIKDNSGFSQFTEKPFQKYKLQNLTLDVPAVKKNRLFWTSVGPNIRHLSLYEVNIKKCSNTMEKVMEFLVHQIPNLESFAVSNVYLEKNLMDKPPGRILGVHPNVKTLSYSNSFVFEFDNFPNLKEVTLDSCKFEDMAYLVASDPRPSLIWRAGATTNSSIQRLKLTNFNMRMYMHFSHLRFTGLKHLSLDAERNGGYIGGTSWFSRFITGHAETLETIEAFGTLKLRCGNDLIRAMLPNLTELRAWGNVFSNLSFIEYTPNLKLLHLDLYGFEEQERMKEELSANSSDKDIFLTDEVWIGVQNNAWQNLSYFQMNYEFSKDKLEILANWMLNLKFLKTVLNKETFPVVCEKWPELEHLESLFGSSILNSNITGVDSGSSDGIYKKALVDMEYLTSFKFYAECNRSLLSDDSVTSGFLRVPKLTNLGICVSPEFSKEAEILLRRGIQNVQVYRNYSSNPLHSNWQCCRNKAYKDFIFS